MAKAKRGCYFDYVAVGEFVFDLHFFSQRLMWQIHRLSKTTSTPQSSTVLTVTKMLGTITTQIWLSTGWPTSTRPRSNTFTLPTKTTRSGSQMVELGLSVHKKKQKLGNKISQIRDREKRDSWISLQPYCPIYPKINNYAKTFVYN